ncbi:hypothetical protein B9Z55_021538 [Caenorhabditis nigoni]|uniref:Uncharacterized protein n=1 Tax=Caenorhabditis nigoni TaxID=1611254 RepID=A0A2G5TSC8_9PELO|nr:hypothetical protein B9Z55_021538 [Caenorhabditis nigoni]
MDADNSVLAPNGDLLVDAFPTKEEIDFFEKFAEIIGGANLVRSCVRTWVMKPSRIVFKNLNLLPTTATLDDNIAEIFDIFIRAMLQKAGGDLESTRYYLTLHHLGCQESDGYWITYKTYKMADGHTLIEMIAKNWQTTDMRIPKVGLDEIMIISMTICKERCTGRRPKPTKKKFGISPKTDACERARIENSEATKKILFTVGLPTLMESAWSQESFDESGVFRPLGYREGPIINDYEF